MGSTFIRLFPPSVYPGLRPIIKLYLRLFRLDAKADYAQYAKYKRVLAAALNPGPTYKRIRWQPKMRHWKLR